MPAQQSALIVHDCPIGWQIGPPSGFDAAQTSCPFGPGMQGVTPPSGAQQSRSFEQTPPAEEHAAAPRQRGTPRGSSWQPPLMRPRASQQSSAFVELPHA
jgi:hypothetical protein